MNIRVLPGLDSDNDAFKGSLELLQHIDVLVTCDSALGHIAGALGIKTYLLLKKYPDWRWCAAEQIEPWYPLHNLRIQDEENEWGKTLTNLALELSNE